MLTHINASDWDHIIVPVSSGKDSQLVLRRALDTPGVRRKLRAVHQFTGFDHTAVDEHLRYMEKRYQIEIEETRHHKFKDLFDFIRAEQYFPSSLARSCTSRLKIQPFALWLYHQGMHKKRTLVLLGMRGPESQNRAANYDDVSHTDMFSICDVSKDYQKRLAPVQCNLPIVNMLTSQVFTALREAGDKVNPLYAKDHDRVGCYPCLLAGNKEWELAARDPQGRKHIEELVRIEDEIKTTSTKKLIRIHPERDVRALLKRAGKPVDPFGFLDDGDSGCQHCNF